MALDHPRKGGVMAELESIVRRMFDGLAKSDTEMLVADIADDAQGVDEISRRWMRDPSEARNYARQLTQMTSDVYTEVNDVSETVWGDAGVLTCWIEQDYTLEGERRHISAPTTIVFRRDGGDWKMALFHSVPLAPEG
jgi:hypothetical protein